MKLNLNFYVDSYCFGEYLLLNIHNILATGPVKFKDENLAFGFGHYIPMFNELLNQVSIIKNKINIKMHL